MRIATWNCQTGLDGNWEVIEGLDADVLTVQECGPETKKQAQERKWDCEYAEGGFGKGLCVLVRPPYRVDGRDEAEALSPYAISTRITSPDGFSFRFVGFWAMTPRFAKYSYTRQATRLISALPDDGLPAVIAGDFNASRSRPHMANVKRLRERGLVSAYHKLHGVEHSGYEEHPTSYFLWRRDRPYHMDFVFVPEEWTIETVTVGKFEEYTAAELSDHVPLVVGVLTESA